MAQQFIDTGNTANDGTGSPLRTAFTIVNDNFTELYNIGGISGIANGTSNLQIVENSTVSVSAANVANVLVVSGTGATVKGTLLANSAISATGNISAGGFYIGNGSQLTGVVSQANAALLTGNVLSANVTSASFTTVGTLAKEMTVAGGAGTDTLVSDGDYSASSTTQVGANVTGFEKVNAGGATVDQSAYFQGLMVRAA
jgi:hypothetical protein